MKTATAWDHVCWANQSMRAHGVPYWIIQCAPGMYELRRLDENGSSLAVACPKKDSQAIVKWAKKLAWVLDGNY